MCLVWIIWDPRNIWNYFFPAYLLSITKVDNLYSEGEVIKITKWLWKSNKKREENFWLSSDMLYYAENYNLPLTVYIYIREIDIRMKLFHGYLFWHISRFIFAMVTLYQSGENLFTRLSNMYHLYLLRAWRGKKKPLQN